MVDLFVELFPIEMESIPPLAAYGVSFTENAEMMGGRLAYQLRQIVSGKWVWTQGRLVTDTPLTEDKIAQVLETLRQQSPEIGKTVESIEFDAHWQPGAKAAADFMLQAVIRALENALRDTLRTMNLRIPNAYILREARLSAWVVDGLPSIALSIHSQLLYEHDLQHYLNQASIEDVLGLPVIDRSSPSMLASIKAHTGKLAEHRERLLQLTKRSIMQEILRSTADDTDVFQVESGHNLYDYVATALQIVLYPQLYQRFNIDAELASKALSLAPASRAQMVRMVSDVLKQGGLIGNAYNSRSHSELFGSLDFMPSLEYGNNRIRPYTPENLAADFVQNGLYARHPRFQDSPIRIAVINTLGDTITYDFVEAMRRQIEKDFGFTIELIKECNVRVLSESNLARAVRAVEKEYPQVILAFFTDASSTSASAETLKSLTIGKGIASHIVYETTMHNPDAMSLVIMGILAKTGNIPFALAEGLDYAHMVVGLDWVHEKLTRAERIVGLSRVYQHNGMFMYYFMDIHELERGDEVPLSIIQTLFPEIIFKGQQVIIHHDGYLSAEILQQLENWAKQLGASFYPVEILQWAVPRLYALESKVAQAPWGSIFLLDDMQAFVVSSIPSADSTARPLHIRTPLANLPIAQAVYSVLAWTLLHYGMLGTPKLPVTIQNADKLAEWLSRGILPENSRGDVPFWL
jgi:hypothetical protein